MWQWLSVVLGLEAAKKNAEKKIFVVVKNQGGNARTATIVDKEDEIAPLSAQFVGYGGWTKTYTSVEEAFKKIAQGYIKNLTLGQVSWKLEDKENKEILAALQASRITDHRELEKYHWRLVKFHFGKMLHNRRMMIRYKTGCQCI